MQVEFTLNCGCIAIFPVSLEYKYKIPTRIITRQMGQTIQLRPGPDPAICQEHFGWTLGEIKP